VESGVGFTGQEVIIITGMLTVLGGTVAALWFAYSQAMQKRIDFQNDQVRMLQKTLLDTLTLLIQIFDRANGTIITAEDKAELNRLRIEIRERGTGQH